MVAQLETRRYAGGRNGNGRDSSACAERLARGLGWASLGLYNGFIPTMKKGDILGHEFMGEGAVMNRSLTIKSGQCHVQRYMRPLLDRIERGQIDPTFVITHRMALSDAPHGFEIFKNKEDDCVKVVLKP